MKVPPLATNREYGQIASELNSVVQKVLESGQYILGEEVKSFEKNFAVWVGADEAVGVASGTDALILSLRALGISGGDEVITTPFTYFATAEAIVTVGAKPVFVDIDPKTFNINPDQIKKKINSKTKAILPVHLYGACADMDPIEELAAKNKLAIIEDACQAHGATYKGRRAGNLGTTGCFSFFPTKNLGACGDAGIITFNQPELKNHLLSLRMHGASQDDKYFHDEFGMNSRLDELQAAILNVKLKYLEDRIEKRRQVASCYTSVIQSQADWLRAPEALENCRHVYHQYVIRTSYRDAFEEHLKKKGISATAYYKYPLHLLPPLSKLGFKKGEFPEAERASQEVLSLPCFPQMTDEEIGYVSEAIIDFKAS